MLKPIKFALREVVTKHAVRIDAGNETFGIRHLHRDRTTRPTHDMRLSVCKGPRQEKVSRKGSRAEDFPNCSNRAQVRRHPNMPCRNVTISDSGHARQARSGHAAVSLTVKDGYITPCRSSDDVAKRSDPRAID